MTQRAIRRASRDSVGFLLAKATQRWNELLFEEFCRRGYEDISPSYGSILLPLFEEDGLPMGELGRRAHLSKQTMTTMVKKMEEKRLVMRRQDLADRRTYRVYLTERSRSFQPVAEEVLEEMDAMVRSLFDDAELTALKRHLKTLMSCGLPQPGKGDEEP